MPSLSFQVTVRPSSETPPFSRVGSSAAQKQHHVALGVEAGQGFQGDAAGFGVLKAAGKVGVEDGGGLPVEQPQGIVCRSRFGGFLFLVP